MSGSLRDLSEPPRDECPLLGRHLPTKHTEESMRINCQHAVEVRQRRTVLVCAMPVGSHGRFASMPSKRRWRSGPVGSQVRDLRLT
jgi:hypothetical protein